jgi:hypothetical protein
LHFILVQPSTLLQKPTHLHPQRFNLIVLCSPNVLEFAMGVILCMLFFLLFVITTIFSWSLDIGTLVKGTKLLELAMQELVGYEPHM